jgi:hypothetical protein
MLISNTIKAALESDTGAGYDNARSKAGAIRSSGGWGYQPL